MAAWHAEFLRVNGRDAAEADLAGSRSLQELQRRAANLKARLVENLRPRPAAGAGAGGGGGGGGGGGEAEAHLTAAVAAKLTDLFGDLDVSNDGEREPRPPPYAHPCTYPCPCPCP